MATEDALSFRAESLAEIENRQKRYPATTVKKANEWAGRVYAEKLKLSSGDELRAKRMVESIALSKRKTSSYAHEKQFWQAVLDWTNKKYFDIPTSRGGGGFGKMKAPKFKLPKNKCRKRLSKGVRFDRRSLRWIQSGSAYLLVGCPKGKYDASIDVCLVGTRAYEQVKGTKSGSCPRGFKRK